MIPLLIIASVVLTLVSPKKNEQSQSGYQHETSANVNTLAGTDTLAEDFSVDESFESHLPLVVIDLKGNTIPVVYRFTSDGQGRTYTEEGLKNPDPWVDMSVSIIDNSDGVNSLSDTPTFSNNALIKYRGMTSMTYEKKQFGIKLMDGSQELEAPLLDMEADEDWILSNSIADLSCIRNYLTMNIGRQLSPYTPETKFCEVIMKDGDKYYYQGLYLLTEKIKKAEGRVDVTDYSPKLPTNSYIVCRDRYNLTKRTLSTWASENGICYGYFTMIYPDEKAMSESEITAIENELSEIEKIIYSDDPEVFVKYKSLIDVDSFVDYFIVNEFFINYDAGNNSTYYYKTAEGKLAIGPIWDYDGAIDNYVKLGSDPNYVVFIEQPWFERLIRDAEFQRKIVKRYKSLRETVLSDEYIFAFIDDATEFLGNAQKREYARWNDIYRENHLLWEYERNDGLVIDRNRDTHAEEIQRIKDVISIHGKWLDENLEDFLEEKQVEEISETSKFDTSIIALTGIIIFVIIVVLLLRVIKGEYR